MANAINSLNYGNNTYTFTLPYGVCSTDADTAAKVVTVDNFSLEEGAVIIVKFTNSNNASSPTLNVNGSGAKPIYRYGTTAASTSTSSTGWRAGAVQMFTYDGTGWVRDFWENSTYSNIALGQGYCSCSTAAGTVAKTASLSSYALSTGGIVSVRFTNGNTASSPTLNINSKGAKSIYYNGAALTDTKMIEAGDVVTFIYSSQYHIISINKAGVGGTGIAVDGFTINHTNSVTAGTVGSAQSPSHGGTFAIPKITYDAQGHITAASTANITLPADNNTTYTFATGDSDGQIKVTPSGGSAQNVSVKGLGSAAYTASTAYASSSHAHGNITNAGAIGTAANKAVVTTTNGVLTTGTVPVASGGTGATTAAAALTNLGLTATAAELNIMDGVTATTAEINKLDGLTATTAELNFVDGVTSAIQTQLDGKAASSHNHAASDITSGTISTSRLPSASGTAAGITIVYPAASCTTFSSDSGTVTPLAVQKGAKMFAITRPTSSTVNAVARYSNTTGDVKDSKIIIEDVTNTKDSSKTAQVLSIPAEGGKKMVYGYCTDQVDGTSFIGGVFPSDATEYPYAEGLAIGGTSGNLLWKGSKVATADDLSSYAPKSHASSATTYGVSTASNYGHAKASGTTPKANGTAAVGSETSSFARGDHVHPLQTADFAVTTAGTGAAYTATVDGITALTAGVSFIMIPNVVSTTASPTLNVNSLGAKNIRRALTNSTGSTTTGYNASWLTAKKPVRVTYDGTYWIVDLPKPAAADISGTLAISKGGTGKTTAAEALASLGITYGDTDLTAGTSALTTGAFYFVYE